MPSETGFAARACEARQRAAATDPSVLFRIVAGISPEGQENMSWLRFAWSSHLWRCRYGRVYPHLRHRFDIRREGREPVDQVLNVAGGDAVLHRERKDVDQFLTGVAQDVRPDNAIGLFVDQHFRPGRGLGISAT